ncbi:unnamed protein product [Closterium sp. NIES-65]|nr:unnamed protein product [Closterium sp. NIES-65]
MDSKHVVYRHYKCTAGVGKNGTKVCACCNFKFVGGVYRCAQHITSWNGMRHREVHLCTAAPKIAHDAVKAHYESKLKAREAKRAAEIAAVDTVNNGSDKKKSRMTDFYGDDAACANQAADEARSLFFAALHVPEHHADHPLWRNVVSSIKRAGLNYIAPKRRFIGGAGLAKCRQRIEAALAPNSASWRRDGVTVASDMFFDKTGRLQANVLLINDSGAVFVKSIDTKMEMKIGGYIAGILRPVIEKLVNGGKGRQVLKPAGTRFGTNYIAINRLCEVRAGLMQMVLSDESRNWPTTPKRVGADTFKVNILDDTWWTRAEFFAKLMKLPFVVMRKTDSDAKGMMGHLYDLML